MEWIVQACGVRDLAGCRLERHRVGVIQTGVPYVDRATSREVLWL